MLNKGATFRYPDVLRCIYCGATDIELTDEHIVPYALGGNLILPKSSCKRCANITHTYERTTLRETLGIVRMRFDFPTRRKRQRPTHIEIGTKSKSGTGPRIKVPVREYPVGACLPGFAGRAGIFYGIPPSLDTLSHVAQKFYLQADTKKFQDKYNWDGIIQIRWMPVEFALTIVKISYCYAVAELGFRSFEPLCVDHILKRDPNLSYVFGQNGINNEVTGVTNVWEVSFQAYKHRGNELLLVVKCSLFPGNGTPIYETVIGRVARPSHFVEWIKMIEEKKLIIQMPDATATA